MAERERPRVRLCSQGSDAWNDVRIRIRTGSFAVPLAGSTTARRQSTIQILVLGPRWVIRVALRSGLREGGTVEFLRADANGPELIEARLHHFRVYSPGTLAASKADSRAQRHRCYTLLAGCSAAQGRLVQSGVLGNDRVSVEADVGQPRINDRLAAAHLFGMEVVAVGLHTGAERFASVQVSSLQRSSRMP